MQDLSYSAGPLFEPRTPVELRLEKSIEINKEELVAFVTNLVTAQGVSEDELSQLNVLDFVHKSFSSYISDNFRLEDDDLVAFAYYVSEKIVDRVKVNRHFKTVYESRRQVRDRNPAGFESLCYPEVMYVDKTMENSLR